MSDILKYIATIGFIGYLPIAPGTFGSLFAMCVYLLLNPSLILQIIILMFSIPVGIVSSHYAEKLLNEKDSGHIVIDEFCGFFVSVLFLPVTAGYALSAFFLFRFFDILKPFPIRKIEYTLKGGLGIVTDDLLAGIYTNAILQLWKLYSPYLQ